MRLTESDIGKGCAGSMVCLNWQSNAIERAFIEYNAVADYIRYTFSKGNMFLDVRDMLLYRDYSGGKVMFNVTDYEIMDDGPLSIFGKFVDIKGGKPHQTEYTRQLEAIANTGGRYIFDIVMDDAGVYMNPDNTAHIPTCVKDIVIVMNPFVFAPWTVNMDCGTVV